MAPPNRSPHARVLDDEPEVPTEVTEGLREVRSRSGIAPTFHNVFKDHFAYVWHSLRRLGVRAGDLEDVSHDAFIVVERRLRDYDPERPIRPWLFGIAYRVAVGHLRLARHRREELRGDLESHAVDDRPDAHEALEAREARELVLDALDGLDTDRRAVLVMHDIDGFGMPEIAGELGIPLDTGYSRLRLARADFKAAVKRLRLQRERGGA